MCVLIFYKSWCQGAVGTWPRFLRTLMELHDSFTVSTMAFFSGTDSIQSQSLQISYCRGCRSRRLQLPPYLRVWLPVNGKVHAS